MRPFEFAEPTALSDTAALLAERAGEARLLAGGQSLLPMMSAKLVSPG
jgi:carbon-monoxide dehydrogenase medium subunit